MYKKGIIEKHIFQHKTFYYKIVEELERKGHKTTLVKWSPINFRSGLLNIAGVSLQTVV